VAFGWKGGIGTSSRRVTGADSSWTVGVLVQSNFGIDLPVLGVPVGRALGRDGVHRMGEPQGVRAQGARGSIMIVIATDAPLSDRNLARLASRGSPPASSSTTR
jgi:D-aminopeptidase